MKHKKTRCFFVKVGWLAISLLSGVILNWLIGLTFGINPFDPIGAVIVPGHIGIILSIFLYQYLCQQNERRAAKSSDSDT